MGLVGLISVIALSCNKPDNNQQIQLKDEKWGDLVRKAELESDTLMMQPKDVMDIITRYDIYHMSIDGIPITQPDSLHFKTYLFGYVDILEQKMFLNLIKDVYGRRFTAIHECLHIYYGDRGIIFSEEEINARALVWYKKYYLGLTFEKLNLDNKKE